MFSAVISVGVAGCGGDDDPAPAPVETTTTDTAGDLTKDELIQQGDDICAEVNSAVGTINSSTTADSSVQESQIADIYSGLAQNLDELGTPTDGDAPTDVIDAAKALSESGASGGDTALTDFQDAATEYGFTECGKDPSAPASSGGSSTGSDSSTAPEPTAPAPTAPPPSTPPPATAPPSTGGGVAPAEPPSSGGSSGGSNSGGGISPG